jgi:UDP-N-acetylmuramoylalanine--D-glutamate ligase
MTTGSQELVEVQPFHGKRVLILGLGSFGGGLGATRFCVNDGAQVTVTDLRSEMALEKSLAQLQGMPIDFRLGGHDGINPSDFDVIIVNPAVPKSSPIVQDAQQRGIPLTSEMNIFAARCPGKMIGITGSNGKTTTTALTAHLMEATDRKVWLGGNIGASLLEHLDEIGNRDAVVLELSSFQLDDMHRIKKSPNVGVLLNLTPNHLDRHGNFEAYAAAKSAVFAYQTAKDIAILNFDDVRVAKMQPLVPSRLAFYSTAKQLHPGGFIDRGEFAINLGKSTKRICPVRHLRLPGRFNRGNALAAILAASVMGAKPDAIAKLLPKFKGVEHRIEFCGERDGVRFYNDSVSTTPESTLASLTALTQDTWLIVGGEDKGLEYDKFAKLVVGKSRVVGAVGIGRVGPDIIRELRTAKDALRKPKFHAITAEGIPEALMKLRKLVKRGQVIVLSPATSSFDQYDNFEQRGAHFKELVPEFRVEERPRTRPAGRPAASAPPTKTHPDMASATATASQPDNTSPNADWSDDDDPWRESGDAAGETIGTVGEGHAPMTGVTDGFDEPGSAAGGFPGDPNDPYAQAPAAGGWAAGQDAAGGAWEADEQWGGGFTDAGDPAWGESGGFPGFDDGAGAAPPDDGAFYDPNQDAYQQQYADDGQQYYAEDGQQYADDGQQYYAEDGQQYADDGQQYYAEDGQQYAADGVYYDDQGQAYYEDPNQAGYTDPNQGYADENQYQQDYAPMPGQQAFDQMGYGGTGDTYPVQQDFGAPGGGDDGGDFPDFSDPSAVFGDYADDNTSYRDFGSQDVAPPQPDGADGMMPPPGQPGFDDGPIARREPPPDDESFQ